MTSLPPGFKTTRPDHEEHFTANSPPPRPLVTQHHLRPSTMFFCGPASNSLFIRTALWKNNDDDLPKYPDVQMQNHDLCLEGTQKSQQLTQGVQRSPQSKEAYMMSLQKKERIDGSWNKLI